MITSEDDGRAFVAARCDPEAFARLETLALALAEENSRQNLIAAASLQQVWQRHIADSAQLLDHAPPSEGSWLDLGSGAGFPGLVIAAMRPGWPVVLVESRRMRIEWLMRVAASLSLTCVRIEGRRLEAVEPFHAGVISARAFAPLPKLVALARRFSTSDTVWLLPKGRSAAQEVQALPSELQEMFHVEQSATDSEAGIVVGRIAKGRR